MQSVGQRYAGLKPAEPNRFLTAVCTFGETVSFPVGTPSPDPMSLSNAVGAMEVDPSGKEMVFTAISQCREKFARYRSEENREVLFFVVTDEAGDDADKAEQLLKRDIPIYVLGAPAPMGLSAAVDSSVEQEGAPNIIRQGPESRHAEHVQLGFVDGANALHLIDSGFGHFALERLCRATGGAYIAMRPATGGYSFVGIKNTEWPTSGAWQPDISVMRRYAPDYVSEEAYQALLDSNAACKALHEAAKLRRLDYNGRPQTSFVKRSEAQLATDVARAQQYAAKHGPPLAALFQLLEKGEDGRDSLPSARWKASYDLAMGRAAAAYARVEGYNARLAELKRGKNFADPSHTTWVLLPAETTDSSSSLRKMGEQANDLLRGVIENHPGTPWAKLAETELQTPIGWDWTEQ